METRPYDGHIPVLLREVVDLLSAGRDRAINGRVTPNEGSDALSAGLAGQVVLDCTAGLGGHAAAIAEQMVSRLPGDRSAEGGVIALVDADAGNLALARDRVLRVVSGHSPPVRIETLHGTFAAAPRWLRGLGLQANVVLADLGFCSNQIEDASRGFSFQRDGPLDMRLNSGSAEGESLAAAGRFLFPPGPSASDLVNGLGEGELAGILREFGEEPAARAIAAKIVRERTHEPITTTSRLAEIVHSVIPRRSGGIDPATRTFQALRIAVNDEMGALKALLDQIETTAAALNGPLSKARGADAAVDAKGWLAPGVRIGIITFHSLEDRPVKQCFARLVERGLAEHVAGYGGPGRPIVAGEDEVRSNPRSRSAKLRVVRVHHPRSIDEPILSHPLE